MSLAGRRILVTGGASGIGAAVVDRLRGDGAVVAAVDIVSPADGAAPLVVRCDVSDPGDVGAAVSAAARAFGGLDGIVTCAGVTDGSPTDTMSTGTWQRLLAVNLTGTFLTVQAALPHLLAARGAAIVTIGSVGAMVAAGRSAAYDATKGGVLALTRGLAAEYADRGLRANCVCPGRVATDLTATSTANDLDPTVRTSIAGRVAAPQGRAAAPAEIAGTVAFLLSAEASFLTGATIPVDGGYTAV